MKVHFLRVIVDEGHVLNNGKSNLCLLASDLFVSYRWVCSGTPGKSIGGTHSHEISKSEERDDLRRLSSMYVFFLHMNGLRGIWSKCVQKAFLSGMAQSDESLQRLFHATMIRNRPEDVRKDVILPELHESLVKLPMNGMQKMVYNLLVTASVTNAVLSQREGSDYFLHAKNAAFLRLQVENVYASCIWYSSYLKQDVSFMLQNVNEALIMRQQRGYSQQDISLLYDCQKVLGDALDESCKDELDRCTHDKTIPLVFLNEDSEKYFVESLDFCDASFKLSSVERGQHFRGKRLIGCGSSKLAYLAERLNEFSANGEKSIVYCNGKSVGWIYDWLKAIVGGCVYFKRTESQNIVTFNSSDHNNVIVMDVQAAYGIDLSKASRIFFLGAITNRSTFKQAVKRAHRIGQSKPVFVETIIMQDTIEELLYEKVAQSEDMDAKEFKSQIVKVFHSLQFLSTERLNFETSMSWLRDPIEIVKEKRSAEEGNAGGIAKKRTKVTFVDVE